MMTISIRRMTCGRNMILWRFVKRIARGASSIGGPLFDWNLTLLPPSRMPKRSIWHCENYWPSVITNPTKGHEQARTQHYLVQTCDATERFMSPTIVHRFISALRQIVYPTLIAVLFVAASIT